MFLSLVYVATVALLPLHSFASASPFVARAGQGVWSPPVTAPQAGDAWSVGSTQLVTWDTDGIPPSAADNTGTLLLGYFEGSSEGENLDIDHPLAFDFLLTDGSIYVEVPDVKPRDTYIVVLMGNSGNASPEFTITKRRSTSSSSDKVIPQKDPKADSETLPKDEPARVLCKERPPSSESGNNSGPAHDTALGEGPNERC